MPSYIILYKEHLIWQSVIYTTSLFGITTNIIWYKGWVECKPLYKTNVLYCRSEFKFKTVSSEISDLCEIPDQAWRVMYFARGREIHDACEISDAMATTVETTFLGFYLDLYRIWCYNNVLCRASKLGLLCYQGKNIKYRIYQYFFIKVKELNFRSTRHVQQFKVFHRRNIKEVY
jgi:hypothetical protein